MPKTNRTITTEELYKLTTLNSPKIPKAIVVMEPRRKEWVGIGWVDCGEPRGNEVRVTD